MKQKTLPTGDVVHYLDDFTVDYVYNEIFVEKCYFQNGIAVKDGYVVFDIGANIGLFTMYVSRIAKNLKIFTFEPILDIFELLKLNTATLPSEIIHNNIGFSDHVSETEIYFNPSSCGQSTLKPIDREMTIQNTINNWNAFAEKFGPILKIIPKFMRESLSRKHLEKIYFNRLEKRPCRLSNISTYMQDHDIKRINLLKIDAENYEKEVLSGIDQEDWSRIDQITMEMHPNYKDCEQNAQDVKDMLSSNGYTWSIGDLDAVGCYNLYASRDAKKTGP